MCFRSTDWKNKELLKDLNRKCLRQQLCRVVVKNRRMSCSFDINSCSSACGVSSYKERGEESGGEGELISAHNSELIVGLWHTGPALCLPPMANAFI